MVSIKGNHNQYDYHLLEPILLTEELLLKCGFTELYSDSKGYIYSVNNIEFIRSYFDTPSYFIKTNEENVLFEKPITYLHQLQNIYFALNRKRTWSEFIIYHLIILGVIPFGFTPFLYHFTTTASLLCITYLIIFHLLYK